ncbi:putative FIT family protein [Clavispora lusitaniae]|uniref:FIT family protein n=1 Tax=Clavispora lusitaniae TaxID=36911 RepID=A0ACD0WS22_CLALS|nr:hypothetical protein E0198_005239 [Clavispora lusitaniae]KAF7580447.1 Inositol phospholipid synthesis and fat-storage-inducing TM family protein [Clavispora lusitaniae]QFZ30319.1 putative FIT family protein [Clavispora lusitaniae]QFZ35981.1 putative FIT family protein [Clavispora lusitaniae]QFZ41665.1 putative FIT family protein [Clavispora lusitaniae]
MATVAKTFSMELRNAAWPSLVFVLVFLVTLPLGTFGRTHRQLITENVGLTSLNAIFVRFGYWWFTAAYFGLIISARRKLRSPFFAYALNSACAIVFQAWFFGPSIVERINRISGGHCVADNGEKRRLTMRECLQCVNCSWIDGFDVSSHYYFLSSQFLLLWHVANCQAPSGRRTVLWILSALLMTIWFTEFCITSVFFHTAGERLAGLTGIIVALVAIRVDLEQSEEIVSS